MTDANYQCKGKSSGNKSRKQGFCVMVIERDAGSAADDLDKKAPGAGLNYTYYL